MATPSAVVFLAEGFEDIEAVSVIDVLRRGGVDVVAVSVTDSLEVKSAHGIVISADKTIAQFADKLCSAVVLPGGMPGTKNLSESAGVIDSLRRHAEADCLVCAICAAPSVLAKAEVLPPGVHVTCYPECLDSFGLSSADVPVVKDGNFITGQAPGSAMLFSLVVLQTLVGEAVAHDVARGMLTDALNG